MRSAFLFFIIIIGGFRLNAQRDSIFISAEWNGKKQINVQQKIIYYNLQNQRKYLFTDFFKKRREKGDLFDLSNNFT